MSDDVANQLRFRSVDAVLQRCMLGWKSNYTYLPAAKYDYCLRFIIKHETVQILKERQKA